jgi:predicted Zn-dependent protease
MKWLWQWFCSIILLVATVSYAKDANFLLPMTSRQINAESKAVYQQILKQSRVVNNKNSALVKKVGLKIVGAVSKYYELNPGRKKTAEDFAWEFNLLENTSPNAWCMPGGKVVVFTGILPYTKNELGLAAVISHEIAHAVLEHGKKQNNSNVVKNIGGLILETANLESAKAVYNYGTGLATLKYSRTHETQADKLGLVFMKLAGYDPEGVLDFWERMSRASGKSSTPQFFSTHPSDETRIKNIRKFLDSNKYRELIR